MAQITRVSKSIGFSRARQETMATQRKMFQCCIRRQVEIIDAFAVDLSASVDAHPVAEAAIGLVHRRESFQPPLVLTFLSTLTHAPGRALSTGRGMSGIVRPSQNSRKKARRGGHHDGHQNCDFVDTIVDTMAGSD